MGRRKRPGGRSRGATDRPAGNRREPRALSMWRMGLSFVSGPVRVRVPATSANLGPGFDALGLALALYDEVTARVTDGGCQVEVTGEGAGELPTDERHLIVRAMYETFDVLGGRPPGIALSCVNRIPQARGLG